MPCQGRKYRCQRAELKPYIYVHFVLFTNTGPTIHKVITTRSIVDPKVESIIRVADTLLSLQPDKDPVSTSKPAERDRNIYWGLQSQSIQAPQMGKSKKHHKKLKSKSEGPKPIVEKKCVKLKTKFTKRGEDGVKIKTTVKKVVKIKITTTIVEE